MIIECIQKTNVTSWGTPYFLYKVSVQGKANTAEKMTDEQSS